MTHGRIETTPEQQLAELRQAYARYSTLAERLHEDDAVDAKVRDARERNARRIALAYEKTIASTAARMESMHRTHADGAGFTRLAKGLSVMLAGAVIVCGALIVYLRPDIGRTLMALIPAQQDLIKSASVSTRVARVAPAPTMPALAAGTPAESAPVIPTPRPAQAEDQATIKLAAKSVAKPAIAPSNERVTNAAPQKEEKRDAKALPGALPGTGQLARTPSVTAAPVKTETAKADTVKAAEPPAPAKPAQFAAAPTPQTPAPTPQAPTPQATVEPLSPPREVAALPSPPRAAETSQSTVQVIETPAAPAPAAATPQASSRLMPVMRTHVRPPYPLDAKRAGEQGTTKMEVSVSAQGAITDCRVTETSGSDRLDSTACSFVRRYWRWEPRDVPGTTKISVIWNLINGN